MLDTTTEYRNEKGQLHREDGPAVEYSNGTNEWWVDDQLHREGAPAIECADGDKEWWVNGQRHREDGPAIEWGDGYQEWYLHGKQLTEDEFNQRNTQTLNGLEKAVVNWACARQIIPNSNAITQCLKTMSEVGELSDNLIKGRDTRDDYGDILVTLIIGMHLQGLTMHECLQHAYDEIKDRKGTLTPDGAFVKEGDI